MKGINQIMRRFEPDSYFLTVFQEKLLKKQESLLKVKNSRMTR